MENDLITAAWHTAAIIQADRARDFAAGRHVMRFEGMATGGGDLVATGDVFLRAILLDAAIDAARCFGWAMDQTIVSERNYLLSRRRTAGVGGWSYFPEFELLAPDTDDLAEMIRVFAKLGDRDSLRRHCARPLAVLLEDCAHSDGAVETWIIPHAGRSPEQDAQLWAARTLWGTGADPAVVANLAHALSLASSLGELADGAEAGARARHYVSQRAMDVDFASAWYAGPYYPAYAAARCLEGWSNPALRRISKFVEARQHQDGGWGLGGQSDALSTALALLATFHCGSGRTGIERGIVALLNIVGSKALEPTSFIQMDTGRTMGLKGRIETYGSSTITAGFVLKALTTIVQARMTRSSRQM